MALTPTEEALVRDLIAQNAALLSLASSEPTILSKLGATKATLSDLTAVSTVADADLLLMRQGSTDKSLTAAILKAYATDGSVDIASLQKAAYWSAVAGGTADAITATFSPVIASLPSAPATLSVLVRAGAANTITTPTFKADGTTAKTIVKGNNQPLLAGDIAGAGMWLELQYDATLDKWVLQNPAKGVVAAADPVSAPVRNTVQSGATAILTTGSGLNAGILATAVPLRLTFAAGFGVSGGVDYPATVSADTTVTCTASQTNYVYADRNTGTGAITFGVSLLAPVMSRNAPSAPATDQHWYDSLEAVMKRWTGSAWATVQRVFIGEAVAGGSTISSVVTYATGRKYESAEFGLAVATAYTVTHNIGFTPNNVRTVLVCKTAELGYSIGDEVEVHGNYNSGGGGNAGEGYVTACRRKDATVTTGAAFIVVLNLTTGAYSTITVGNWKLKTYLEAA